eukprot:scaffold4873_cov83-Skeletonema_dohrnii-CCMP3373.AAC.1
MMRTHTSGGDTEDGGLNGERAMAVELLGTNAIFEFPWLDGILMGSSIYGCVVAEGNGLIVIGKTILTKTLCKSCYLDQDVACLLIYLMFLRLFHFCSSTSS